MKKSGKKFKRKISRIFKMNSMHLNIQILLKEDNDLNDNIKEIK